MNDSTAPRYRAPPIAWPFDQMRQADPASIPNDCAGDGRAAAIAEYQRVARCARQAFRRWRAADPGRAGLRLAVHMHYHGGLILAWVTGSKAEHAAAYQYAYRLANPNPPPPMPGFPPAAPLQAPAAPAPKPATPAAAAVTSAEPGSEATDYGEW